MVQNFGENLFSWGKSIKVSFSFQKTQENCRLLSTS